LRIIHRVSFSDKPERTNALRSLGIAFNEPSSPLVPLVWFDIAEDHPSWSKLETRLKDWKAGDVIRTEFSSAELACARYLSVEPTWHFGYPQPEDDFGYLEVAYDLKAHCSCCGIGKTQIAPFRMKGEPKWGKKHILQLNWVFDEYFVLPEVWKEVFDPLGIGCLPVLKHRAGDQLKTVVQLQITRTATSPLVILGEYPATVCESCGRKKYLPISRGQFPMFEKEPSEPACRTQEFFGSGLSAWNAIVVSSEVFRAIQAHKLKGAAFVPLASR
jgi:hypothetical protein